MDDLERLKELAEAKALEANGWRDVVLHVAGLFGFREPLENASYSEAQIASEGLEENFDIAHGELKARAEAAEARVRELEANQRTPGTVEVCPRRVGHYGINTCKQSAISPWKCDAHDCPIKRSVSPSPASPQPDPFVPAYMQDDDLDDR